MNPKRNLTGKLLPILATTPDVPDLAYFLDVLRRLDALQDRAMKSRDGHLAARASAAFEPMGFLVGCLLADAGQTGYPMTGAEQEKYLASVEENLRALVGRTPPNSELFDQAVRALNAIGTLIECFQPVPDREPGE